MVQAMPTGHGGNVTPTPVPSDATSHQLTPAATWRACLSIELRIIGSGVLLPAVLLPIAGGLLVALLHAAGRPPSAVDGAAGLALEGILPLGTAVAVVTLVGRDRAVELVLATPARYARVLFTRIGIVAAVGAVTSLIVAVAFYSTGAWPDQLSSAGIVLAWAAPLIWLGALGLLAAVASTTAAVGTGLVGGLWLAEILGTDTMTASPALRAQYLFSTHVHMHGGTWLTNRVALLAVGVVALAGVWALLGRAERLLAMEAA